MNRAMQISKGRIPGFGKSSAKAPGQGESLLGMFQEQQKRQGS